MSETRSTRRNVLGRGLALAGAIGLGTRASAAGAARLPAELPARLVGRFVLVRGSDVRHARLVDEHGRPAGTLYVTVQRVLAPFDGPSPAATAAEQFLLDLRGGTLHAQGLVRGGRGELAIVGGTGRYAHARGTLAATHQDGTVLLDLNLDT
jgi:hypothetical protein